MARLEPRRALQYEWDANHQAGLGLSAIYFTYAMVRATVFGVTRSHLTGLLVLSFTPVVLVALTTAARRRALQQWLCAGNAGAHSASAGVGALLGPVAADEAFEHGQLHFRAVPFSALREEFVSQTSKVLDHDHIRDLKLLCPESK